MTQDPNAMNPFGEGGLDLGAMLEQAQQMQQQLMQAQAELADTEVTGTSGGVSVTVNGTGELTAVSFTAAAVGGPGEAPSEESLADLGDLVVAAYRDAKHQADQMASEKLGPLTGGLGGPGEGPGGGPGGLEGGPGFTLPGGSGV